MRGLGFLWSVAATTMLLSGCAEECEECQAAIDHMAAKLSGQGCQPSSMQKAVNRIREDCDSNFANWYIGRLVDMCYAGAEPSAICETHTLISADFTMVNDFGEEVDFTYVVEGKDKELVTGLQAGGRENGFVDNAFSGATVSVEALDANGALLATGEAPIVLRTNPAQWEPWQTRTVMLTTGPVPGAPPELVFTSWE